MAHQPASTEELEQRAIALGNQFGESKELAQALAARHPEGFSPEQLALLERMQGSPFALSRAFTDI